VKRAGLFRAAHWCARRSSVRVPAEHPKHPPLRWGRPRPAPRSRCFRRCFRPHDLKHPLRYPKQRRSLQPIRAVFRVFGVFYVRVGTCYRRATGLQVLSRTQNPQNQAPSCRFEDSVDFEYGSKGSHPTNRTERPSQNEARWWGRCVLDAASPEEVSFEDGDRADNRDAADAEQIVRTLRTLEFLDIRLSGRTKRMQQRGPRLDH